MTEVMPGDFILTRNLKEEDNESPGWWNHCAIYVGNSEVVEAQIGKGVIVSTFSEFWARYPYIMVLRYAKTDQQKRDVLVHTARKRVGTRYKNFPSIWFWTFEFTKGDNCVSLVRRCFNQAYRYDRGWKFPDDLAKDFQMRRITSRGIR